MPVILISGAGSGIGHTFLEHYAKDSTNTIHALDIAWSEEFDTGKAAANVTTHTVNSASKESLDELTSKLNNIAIDLFIHSAAVRGLNPEIQKKDDNPANAELLDVIDVEIFTQTLTVNTVGTFMIIRAVLPNLKAAKSPKVIVMGSGMGSIANNKGGAYAYGSSKAALNYVVKSFVGDVPEVVFGIIHPGKVESRMTHVREDGAIDADEAIAMMLPIIEGLKQEQSGIFVTRENKPIPW
jgi:NAD(P)-dependent dehydrogenase (short-subunit alcohol dehydrogenase family)